MIDDTKRCPVFIPRSSRVSFCRCHWPGEAPSTLHSLLASGRRQLTNFQQWHENETRGRATDSLCLLGEHLREENSTTLLRAASEKPCGARFEAIRPCRGALNHVRWTGLWSVLAGADLPISRRSWGGSRRRRRAGSWSRACARVPRGDASGREKLQGWQWTKFPLWAQEGALPASVNKCKAPMWLLMIGMFLLNDAARAASTIERCCCIEQQEDTCCQPEWLPRLEP